MCSNTQFIAASTPEEGRKVREVREGGEREGGGREGEEERYKVSLTWWLLTCSA